MCLSQTRASKAVPFGGRVVQLSAMRDYVRNVVDITSNDISDATMNTFIREGYDIIVYSEKRWPFYEVALTFDTVASQKDYTLSEVGAAISVSSMTV